MSRKQVVGVIGLGDIGRGVATGVAAAGHDLVVCDVRPEATAAFAGSAEVALSPADLGVRVDVAVVAVVNDEQVRQVVLPPDGLLSTMSVGGAVVILSTVSLDTVRAVADGAAGRGVAVVDCGVSGGPSAAATGELVSMVGGGEDAVAQAMPVLEAFSSEVVRMGPLGAGLQAKLARNIVQYVSWMAAYEAQKLAEAAGVSLTRLARVIKASDAKIGGASTLMFRKTVAPFGPEDDAGLVGAMRTAAGLAHKDLGAALSLATELGVELPVTALAESRIDDAFGVGHG
ncbi:MAG TPA: NAD(P)-dependent oxidoreductase [Acidimicrobiales bacterium]|nr:NAD(P)-dependent oxidoreductase [Acidimicrobiales bacterium]